ncbi:MAG: AAA family ATPase [Myxococcota bacterium]
MIHHFGSFDLDLHLFELRSEGAPLPVQPKVLDLLAYLVLHRERVVSKQELLERVWPEEVVSEAALTHAIMEARRALSDDGSTQRWIQTVRRRGYRFVGDVRSARAVQTHGASRRARGPAREPFIGRVRALDRLHRSLADALSGRGRLVLLVGEPGIGKTRTAEELAHGAREAGAEVLLGRCVEGEGAPAYWPWVQIVRAWVEERDDAEIARLFGARAALIGRAIPEVAARLGGAQPEPDLEPAEARFRLFDALCGFLRAAARERPLVLVLDDLHRADRPSLLLLQFLVRELRDAHILVLGTYRDSELVRDAGLARILGEIVREDPSRSLGLEGLDRGEVARFLEETTGESPPETLVTSLWERTGGNPFFLRQVVQLLEDEGRLEAPSADGSWDVPLTRGVREAIRRHLDGVSEACRAMLEVASVAGREFGLRTLAEAMQESSERLLERLDEAVASHVLTEPSEAMGGYRFAHSLIRETLYGELSASRRSELHRRTGEALLGVHGADVERHLSELAFHFVQAAPAGAAEPAIEYSIRAASRATAQLAYEQAVTHLEHALAALGYAHPDEPRRCELLIRLGAAHWRAGEGERARERYLAAADVARTLGEPERLARAALGLGVWDQDDIVDEVLVGLLEEALEALPASDSGLRARAMGRLARELRFTAPPERLARLSQGGVEMARRVGDSAALAEALVARHWALWGPGNTEDRFAAAVEIVTLAEEIENPVLGLQGHQFQLADLLELGDLPAVDTEIDRITWLADDLQRPQHLWFATVFRAMRAQMNGHFSEAETLATAALEIGERVHRETAIGWHASQTAAIQRARGRLEEAATALGIFRRQFPWVATWRAEWILALAQLGHTDRARRELDLFAAADFRDLRPDGTWLATVAFLAEACSLLEDRERAAALYGLLEPHAARIVSTPPGVTCYGSADRFLGLLAATLGRGSEAAHHLERALEVNSAIGARPLVAQTLVDRAALQLAHGARGDRKAASRDLGAALETARELGMRSLERRIADLGERPEDAAAKAPPAAGAR